MSALPNGLTFSAGLIREIPRAGGSDDVIVASGWIDLQVNGGWGHDFTAEPSSIWEVGRRLPETGVTAFLPTIISAPYQVADTAIEVLRSGPPPGYSGAEPIGLHIEGPWISTEWHGAHNLEHIRSPDPAVARRWAEAGVVRMVTIAPELENAGEVATVLSEAGVVVSAGHSGADFDTAFRALGGAWSSVTHLYNQMSGFHHRAPGLVGATLLADRPTGVIVDGIHSDPAAIRLAWRLLGPDRLMLVTDAMQATGLGHGRYLIGDQTVDVGPEGPRIWPETLAGSTLTMDRAVANLVEWTPATIHEALTSASLTPATLIGAEDRGRLAAGMRADLVILDQDLRVLETIIGGEVVYRSEDR